MSHAIIDAITEIILATCKYTELFIAHGLMRKMQELLRRCYFVVNCSILYCLCALSVQTIDIVDEEFWGTFVLIVPTLSSLNF